MDIFNRLQDVFRDVFDDIDMEITREMSAEDVDDWDSLMQIDIIVACEKEFSIRFDLRDIQKLRNIGDTVDLIEKMLST